MYFTLFSLTLLPLVIVAKPFPSLHSRAVAIEGYDYAGCFTESPSGRALMGKTFYDDQMTTEKCAAACAGFTWFGTEYGRECYCGQTLSTKSKISTEISCSYACKGNSNERCGGENRLSTYALTGTTTPYQAAGIEYRSLGCYAEPRGGRALKGGSYTDDNMTVAKCQAQCDGFTYFGLEYSRECFCGNDLTAGTTKAAETDCVMPCKGDLTQTCGGAWRLSIYTSAEGADPPPVESTYARQGCYTDKTTARALSSRVYLNDAMTVEKCSSFCKGFAYFGLEYGKECYCGNVINASGQSVDDVDCKFACPGDSTQKCGAGDRLDLYQFGKEPISIVSSSTTATSFVSTSSGSTTSMVTSLTDSTSTTTSSAFTTIDVSTSASTTSGQSAPISTTTTGASYAASTASDHSTTTTTSTTGNEPTTASTSTSSDVSATVITTSNTEAKISTTIATSVPATPSACAPPANGNTLLNPSFEDSLGETIDSWKRTVYNADNYFLTSDHITSTGANAISSALCGNNALVYHTTGGTIGRLEQRLFSGINPGGQYNISAYVNRAHHSNAFCRLYIYVTDTDLTGLLNLNTVVTGDEWQIVNGIYKATKADLVLQIIAICSEEEEIYIDQVVVEPLTTV